MANPNEQQPSPAQLADLSALADGSLDPARREAVEEWIAGSVPLRTLYEREREAVWLLRAAGTERAPARLRMRLEAQRREQARRSGWSGWQPARAAIAGVVACAVVAVVLLLPGGSPGSPSVSEAAQLALRGPSGPAPAADPTDPRMKLDQRLQGLYFPNWADTLGWRAVGVRTDQLKGRKTVTVYYQHRGKRIAYTIVGAPVLAQPSSPITHRGSLVLHTLSLRGRTVVTWRRAGHTCVISASGVPAPALERLADWQALRISD